MDKRITIEVCCGSVDDAIEAQKAGADRVELNSSLFFGGLTPSIGSVIQAKKVLDIPVMVMIRPRGGGFCYTDSELRVMEEDILAAIEHGADGIVFGILKEDGTLDYENCARMIKLCGDKEVVFHRALDVVPDPFSTIDQLVDLGFKRILTKGQQNTLEEGVGLLKEIIKYAENRIEILPGGCKPYNIDWAIKELAVDQIHIASFVSKTDLSASSHSHVFFGSALRPSECQYDLANFSYIKNMRDKCDKLNS